MDRIMKTLLLISFIIGFEHCLFSQVFQSLYTGTGKTIGLEVVFVVDISQANRQYRNLVEGFVEQVCDMLPASPKTGYHLITFADSAKLFNYNPGKIDKEGILKEIQNEMKTKRKRTSPEIGLLKVFDLVLQDFPEKVGIVFLISDYKVGLKKVQDQEDLKWTIGLLKKSGYTTFSIYIPPGKPNAEIHLKLTTIFSGFGKNYYMINNDPNNNRKEVEGIVAKALAAKFSSPVSRVKFKNHEDSWREQNKQLELENEIVMGKINALEVKKEELIRQNKTQKSILILSYFIMGIFLLALILAALYIYFLRKRSQVVPLEKKHLWGILAPQEGFKRTDKINLGSRSQEVLVETSEGIPDIKLVPCSYDGKRVLCVHAKNCSIKCYNDDEKWHKTHYIDPENTKKVKISGYLGKNEVMFNYYFLDLLKKSYQNPVSEVNDFFGQIQVLEIIARNFLKKVVADQKNIVISGMQKSGKSSLLWFLKKICTNRIALRSEYSYLRNNYRAIRNKYIVGLIRYDPEKHRTFNKYKKDFDKIVNELNGDERKKILLIDDYDILYQKFKKLDKPKKSGKKDNPQRSETGFDKLLNKLNDEKIYFIAAGRMPRSIINDFPNLDCRDIVLKGIEDLHSFANSNKLIGSICEEIGFPNILNDEIKKEIAIYASKMPFFCKKILYEVLSKWLKDPDKNLFVKEDVEKAVIEIVRNDGEEFKKKNVTRFDTNPNSIPFKGISFEDITSRISQKYTGRIKRIEVENQITGFYQYIEGFNKDYIDIKIRELIELGLIEKDGDYLVGIPHLFYYRRRVGSEH